MREIALFVEDHAHQAVLAALLQRLADEYNVKIKPDWRNARRGHGAVINELKQFLRDLLLGRNTLPDLVIVATDANCKGLTERLRQVTAVTGQIIGLQTICAVPDPHIERWLLIDSSAFKAVFGKGCNAPDQKCERARYKKMLIDAIRKTGISPSLGGIEFAGDIVREMNFDRATSVDPSLAKFIADLRLIFQSWQS